MTSNLKKYILFCLVWSVTYFSILNWALNDQKNRWPLIVLFGIIYSVGFGILGKYFGQKDDASKVAYNLNFAYGASSNIISTLIGLIWILVFKRSYWPAMIIILLVEIIIISIYMLITKKYIKGIPSRNLFK